MDGYATHLASLVAAALEAAGPILELGCGDYSTPVLAAIARHKGVPFMVMTSSPEWGARFAHLCDLEIVQSWHDADLGGPWGLVFLDNEQTTDDRIRHLPALAKVTRCVVLHDLDASERHGHWPQMIAPFSSVEAHRSYVPATGILRC